MSLPYDPQAFWTLIEIFDYRSYRPVDHHFAPNVIFDIGANIGVSSLYFHGLFPKACIVCIEPDPDNLRLLSKNLNQNRVDSRIVPVAVASEKGKIQFKLHKASSEYNSIYSSGLPESEFRSIEVEALSLDDIAERLSIAKIDLLKIDAEGAEFGVLIPGSQWMKSIDYIAGEFHSFAGDIKALIDGCTSRSGFSVVKSSEKSDVPIIHLAKSHGYENRI